MHGAPVGVKSNVEFHSLITLPYISCDAVIFLRFDFFALGLNVLPTLVVEVARPLMLRHRIMVRKISLFPPPQDKRDFIHYPPLAD